PRAQEAPRAPPALPPVRPPPRPPLPRQSLARGIHGHRTTATGRTISRLLKDADGLAVGPEYLAKRAHDLAHGCVRPHALERVRHQVFFNCGRVTQPLQGPSHLALRAL